MSELFVRCSNEECFFHVNLINWPEGVAPGRCPICGSALEFAGEHDGGMEETSWLLEIAENEQYWAADAETVYPSILAHEYRNLRRFSRDKRAYAVLLSLKDNFEALLKFEVLLAFSWAAQQGGKVLEEQVVSQLMEPNLSLGAWVNLALVIKNGLKKAGLELPAAIPLEKIRKKYEEKKIAKWRNDKIGHGAMEMVEDKNFQKDIRDKIMILKNLYMILDDKLREQELYLPENDAADGNGQESELILTGADKARRITRTGKVHFRSKDRSLDFCVDPFITIREQVNKEYGIYFFDNQRTRSLTFFLAYAEGNRAAESVGYFEYLRKSLESAGIRVDARADDLYLTEDEVGERDMLHMSHGFVKPGHLVEWLASCFETHDKGVFLLQMDRGTGKSVFTEMLSGLTKNPVQICDDLDVRTYHFTRTQTAGLNDVRSGIEWMWGRDFYKKTWVMMPHISEYENKGMGTGEALCAFLKEALGNSRRNRKKDRILMVLDGLDEISDESLWKFIPTQEMLEEGIYILLTSRNPENEELTEDVRAHLKNISVTDAYYMRRDGTEYISFLKEYISKTNLEGLTDKEEEELISLSDYRVLQLGLLCRLAETGMRISELPDRSRLISVYLDTLRKRYGDKGAVQFREILSIFCTFGTYGGITLETLGALTGQNGITLELIGMIRDLSPMLRTERGEEGNLYTIANDDLTGELVRQIPETEMTVRQIVNLVMSVMRDGNPVEERGLDAAAAHVVDLAYEMLPDGLEALGSDADEVLRNCIERSKNRQRDRRAKERDLNLWNQLYKYRLETIGDDAVLSLEACNNLSVALSELGRYGEALDMQKELYEKCKEMPEAEYSYIRLQVLHNMAVSLGALGYYEDALEIEQGVYEARKKAFGAEDLKTLDDSINLIIILRKLGRYEEALARAQETYGISKKEYGDEHSITLKAKSNLASALVDLGRYEEALVMQREVYEKRKKLQEGEEQDTISVGNNLAITLGKLGQHEEALAILREVYEKSKKLNSSNHPESLTIQNNMATELRGLSRYKEALAIEKEIYEKRKQLQGETHPETLEAINNLAATLVKLGHYKEALDLEREVYDGRKSILEPDHPDVITAQNNLAFILAKLGRYEEALVIQEDLYEKRKRILGEDHPRTIMAHQNLALTLKEIGRAEEALAIERDAYEKLKKKLGPGHPDTLIVLTNLASTLGKLGKHEEALDMELEVYKICMMNPNARQHETLTIQNNMADTLKELSRYEEALSMQKDVYEKSKELFGEKHRDTLTALTNFAAMLFQMGYHEEALRKMKKAYHIRKEELGEEDPDTLVAQRNVAFILEAMGRKEEALTMEQEALEIEIRALGKERPKVLFAQSNLATRLAALRPNGGPGQSGALGSGALGSNGGPGALRSGARQGQPGALRQNEALDMALDAYETYIKVFGEDDKNALTLKNNVAFVLVHLGRAEEALELYEDVYEKRKRILGKDNEDTIIALSNLVYVLMALNRYEESRAYCEELYETQKRVLGVKNQGTLSSLNNLAISLDRLGRYKEAIDCQKELVYLLRGEFGEDPRIVPAVVTLAEYYQHAGILSNARDMARYARNIMRSKGVTNAEIVGRIDLILRG